MGNNTYRVPVNFYKTDYYSFGTAEMIIYKDALTIKPIGFNDTWNLDFKEWEKGRSKKAEIVTRAMYGIFGGENYKVVYP